MKKVYVCFDYTGDRKNLNQIIEWNTQSQLFELLVGESINNFDEVSEDAETKSSIKNKIDECSTLLCLVDQETHLSKQIEWEIKKAIESNKDIIGVRIKPSYKSPTILQNPIVNWVLVFEKEAIYKAINFVEDIADLVVHDRVIPVIGYEVLFWDGADGLQLKKKFVEEICKEINREDLLQNFTNQYPENPLSEIINYIYHSLGSDAEKIRFHGRFSEAIDNVRIRTSIYFDPLIKLARIKNFSLYINATCVNAIQVAVSTYKSKEFLQYGPFEKDQDLPVPTRMFRPGTKFKLQFEKPSIYNLFGTHNKTGEYYLTDANYIDLLTDLLQEGNNNRFPQLKEYLKNNSLLFIGCSLPDWFLRFLIRFWVGPEIDKASSVRMNSIVDEIHSSDRLLFLNNYKISFLPYKGIDFINRLYQELKKRNAVDENSYNNYVMISYATENKDKALEIHNFLELNKHIDCQFDEKDLVREGRVNDELSRLIGKCCAAVIIVSDAFQRRQEDDPYFLREWELIFKQGKPIFKIFVDSTNDASIIPDKYKAKYGEAINKVISRNDFFCDWQKGGLAARNEIAERIAETQYQACIKNINKALNPNP